MRGMLAAASFKFQLTFNDSSAISFTHSLSLSFCLLSALTHSHCSSSSVTPGTPPAPTLSLFGGGGNGPPGPGAASNLSALASQHRLLELSRFGLRGYDLAQHMLSQQGAVSKLLGKFFEFALRDSKDAEKVRYTEKWG